MKSLIKPQKLEKGDKVAVVTSSWGGPATCPEKYQYGVSCLERIFSVDVVAMPHALKDAEWLQRNPKARAEDLMMAFSDPSIKAIISSIGGDDSVRMLPWIDLNIIRNNPKIFMGYSDTTISHLACFKAGLSSFYGPSIMSGFAENGGMWEYTINSIRNVLMSTEPVGEIPFHMNEWAYKQLPWEDPKTFNTQRPTHSSTTPQFLQGSGIIKGRLIGGCIDVLEFIKGTDFWPDGSDWDNAILFLETSEEAPSPETIRRWLRNYVSQGIMHKIKALIFGRPGGMEPDMFSQYDRVIRDVIANEAELKELPIITMLDFGHTDPMYILPYGMYVEIDMDNKKIKYKEAAVV